MRFSGLVKGARDIGQIRDAFEAHGFDRDFPLRLKVKRVTTDRRGSETHFEVESECADSLERAIHGWFQEPGEAPFPEGTLLHFSYRTEGVQRLPDGSEMVTGAVPGPFARRAWLTGEDEAGDGPDAGC